MVKRLSPLKHGDVLVQQEWIALRLIIDLLQQFSVSCLTGRQCLFDQAVTGLHRKPAQGEDEHGGVVLKGGKGVIQRAVARQCAGSQKNGLAGRQF